MGRVLLVAAEYPFKRVIGIEFSPRLHEIALENISQYRSRSQKCFDITSVCIDAALFDLPDDPCVIYMFDPFRKAVLEKLVSKIGRSYIDRRRKIVIVYYAPIHKEVFDAAWFLREMKAITLPADRSGRRPYKVALYETVPAGVLPDAALATPPTGLLG
jgi:hypothetical protein